MIQSSLLFVIRLYLPAGIILFQNNSYANNTKMDGRHYGKRLQQ